MLKHDHNPQTNPTNICICNQEYLLELLNIPQEDKQFNLHGLELTSLQINLDRKIIRGKDIGIGIESDVWWFSVYIWGGSNSVISEEQRRLEIFMIWGNVSNEEELPILMEILSVEGKINREREVYQCLKIGLGKFNRSSLLGRSISWLIG